MAVKAKPERRPKAKNKQGFVHYAKIDEVLSLTGEPTGRYIWRCRCGKTSGRCTFPTQDAALKAGKHHCVKKNKPAADWLDGVQKLTAEQEQELRSMSSRLKFEKPLPLEEARMLPRLRFRPRFNKGVRATPWEA